MIISHHIYLYLKKYCVDLIKNKLSLHNDGQSFMLKHVNSIKIKEIPETTGL